ncbi:hypothetical protein BJ170DRAFT_603193 [Xylariales sp. AK1849]|nr:hypothetical protein BJ170DRAFT_603193 [Xylariales sp. AK1849]
MKISGRIDGSIYGTILKSRPSTHSSGLRALYSTTRTNHGSSSVAVSFTWHSGSSRPNTPTWQLARVAIFSSPYSTVTSRGSRRPLGSLYFTSHPPTCGRNWNNSYSSRSAVPGERPVALRPIALPPPKRLREELLAFVDQYEDVTVEEQLEFLRDPYMRRYAPPATPKLTISDNVHHMYAPLPEDVQREGPEEQEIVTKLRASVFSRLLRPHSVDTDTIYDLYRALPEPRITFLPARLRHALLAALGVTERKNAKSMLRYFAVVADVKNSGFSLSGAEWNTAISFASRYVATTTVVEAEAALHLWREMEHEAGIKGNEATFNILFDAASKAGKFALAEMIYQEMNTRGIHFNRYHHVSLIHFFGLKMDASGVRAAYKEMVQAGEIIDSLTLNCVITGLLRSGEDDAAERVYEKMKTSDERSKLIPHRDYAFNKMVTKVLMMFAKMGRVNPEMHSGLQGTGMVTPDLHTYRILLNHFGVRRGQMSKVAQYLDEMKFFRVPLHGAIFLALFKGFAVHGAVTASEWSLQRLTSVWGAFLDAYDAGADGLYINTWIAMWALRAFARCSQSRQHVLAVYEDLKLRWDLDATNESFMLDFLHKLLSKNGWSVQSTPTSILALGSGSHRRGYA